jgi:hypothetical protein
VSGWGNFIVIKHTGVVGYPRGALYSIYAHLASFEARIQNGVEGDTIIKRGEKIGTMGYSGLGTDPNRRHLHFQIDHTWASSKRSPFWPTYTNRPGTVVAYPTTASLCGSEIDNCLTFAQRQEAATNVANNTVNPMRFVESGVIDLDLQAQEDIKNAAAKDTRFGTAIPGTFGNYPNWDPDWDLRWTDYIFSGNRTVRIFQITHKAYSAYRFTIFYDPDTNSWTSWIRVL